MQSVTVILILLATFLLQNNFSFLSSFDFLLPLLIAIIVKLDSKEAALYSFGIGFVQDSFLSVGFINTLVKTIISISASYLKSFVVLDENKICMLFALIFTPVSIIGSVVFTRIFGQVDHIKLPWLNIIFWTGANILLAPLFYSILSRIYKDE